MNDELRYAILIDADNISSAYIKIILDEISNKGVATYKRIYGDFTKSNLASWKDILLEYSITPMQQYNYTSGKNSSDSAMIIDAMDILYSGKVDGFCLATSDSDFTKLAARLRESGMKVIGMGEKKTPRPFIAACDEFKFIDNIAGEKTEHANSKANSAAEKNQATKRVKTRTKKAEKENASKARIEAEENATPVPSLPTETSQTDLETIITAIHEIIGNRSDDDGWLQMSEIGDILPKRYADFDVRNFGYKKMLPFLKSLDLFEIRMVQDPANTKNPNGKVAYIKLK